MAGLSPLTRRMLTVNMLPLAVLAAGILYLDDYQEGLIEAELTGLEIQAEIFAGALGEGAVGTGADDAKFIQPDVARPMLRRLVLPTRTRARVFDATGAVVADSRFLEGGAVQVEVLTSEGDFPSHLLDDLYDALVALIPDRRPDPPFPDDGRLDLLPAVEGALDGDVKTGRWSLPGDAHRLGAAAPVQRFKQVLGAVFVTAETGEIDAAVRDARFDILQAFAVALGVTVLLSLYLAGAIARPVRRLASAADAVRRGQAQAEAIPDFTRRRDEIGELSAALREMTDALWQRMIANERFAADVAHEIKNPLTSLRSAVETLSRVRDPKQRATLMGIIEDDIGRLDRLITDISDASRLDAELALSRMRPVDLDRVLPGLIQALRAAEGPDAGRELVYRGKGACTVMGVEIRLVQVFQNLIANARSFSPPDGVISLSVRRERDGVTALVEDQGSGIPPESLDSVFERFYSERPEGESFGRHSGLGLSISRQIVEAHGGSIHAENLLDADGRRAGARFVVRFPVAP